jgi:serine/threonine-protein kinase
MRRLDHPNIARTEATFRDRDNYYTVQEYVEGRALSEWADRGQKLDLGQAIQVAVALCDALSYIHRMRIVHCDLNPSNVLLDANGRPKLIDLGIAHVSDAFVHRSWHTMRDFAMGTVLYMAPEQLDGVREDPRIDLYALAALLYQMLAGRFYLDFDLRSTPSAQADNIRRVRNETPEPIPGVPSAISDVVLRALAKDPDDRHPDVATFRRELVEAALAHIPSEQGIELLIPWMAPLGAPSRGLAETRASSSGGSWIGERRDWPLWVWGVLLAVNLVVMLVIALLLFRSM